MIVLEEVFSKENIYFELYDHRAIYTNEDALVVKAEQGFEGTETKSLFLESKTGKNFIYFTFTTKKTDFKALKNLVGEKLSIVPTHIMEKMTNQKAGAVSPLGYENNIPIIVDEELLLQEKLVFAPGRPDQTMVIKVEDLNKIFNILNVESFVLKNTD